MTISMNWPPTSTTSPHGADSRSLQWSSSTTPIPGTGAVKPVANVASSRLTPGVTSPFLQQEEKSLSEYDLRPMPTSAMLNTSGQNLSYSTQLQPGSSAAPAGYQAVSSSIVSATGVKRSRSPEPAAKRPRTSREKELDKEFDYQYNRFPNKIIEDVDKAKLWSGLDNALSAFLEFIGKTEAYSRMSLDEKNETRIVHNRLKITYKNALRDGVAPDLSASSPKPKKISLSNYDFFSQKATQSFWSKNILVQAPGSLRASFKERTEPAPMGYGYAHSGDHLFAGRDAFQSVTTINFI